MAGTAAPPSVISRATEFLIGPRRSEERLRGFQTMASQLRPLLWENKQCERVGGRGEIWCVKKSIEWVSCVSRWSCLNDSHLTVSAKKKQQHTNLRASAETKPRLRRKTEAGKDALQPNSPLHDHVHVHKRLLIRLRPSGPPTLFSILCQKASNSQRPCYFARMTECVFLTAPHLPDDYSSGNKKTRAAEMIS